MYQKNSQRGKSASLYTHLLAQKIYSSSRTIEKKYDERPTHKSNHVSINHDQNKYFFNQLLTKRKCSYHFPKNIDKSIQNFQSKYLIKLPAFKKIESESTAQDFAQKIKKSKSIHEETRNKIKSYLLARSRKNQQPLNTIENTIDKEEQPVSYEKQQYSQNLRHPRKILPCKIIRSPAIPFPFPIPLPRRCKSNRKRFQSLVTDTENISIINVKPDIQFISPQSQQFLREI